MKTITAWYIYFYGGPGVLVNDAKGGQTLARGRGRGTIVIRVI